MEMIFKSAEEVLAYLETIQPTGGQFQLAISDSFTFAGQPDTIGAGMAVMLDKILGLGYEPEGFDQKDGYKLYKYKQMEEPNQGMDLTGKTMRFI
jgi:hypothetical protein